MFNYDICVTDDIIEVCEDYWNRIYHLEGFKWELERTFMTKNYEVNIQTPRLDIKLSDIRNL